MDFAARAEKNKAEAAVAQFDAETDRIKALSSNLQKGDADEKEFQKRARVAELILKEQEINLKREMQNANTKTDAGNPAQSGEPMQRPSGAGLGTSKPIAGFGGQTSLNPDTQD
jgi:hypothetical protein